jgi:hypothetical protein
MAAPSAEDLYGHLVGEFVIVTFSDGGREVGQLNRCINDLIEVDQIDLADGQRIWTATYTLVGDDDTPRVMYVVLAGPQHDALFTQGELFG